MKLTDNGLKAIKARHETDARLYNAIKDPGWQGHQDRAALLEHIEDVGAAARFGRALGGVLGAGCGWALMYLLFRWLIREDLAAAGAWLAAHIRVVG